MIFRGVECCPLRNLHPGNGIANDFELICHQKIRFIDIPVDAQEDSQDSQVDPKELR
jgi:hypothetical protein